MEACSVVEREVNKVLDKFNSWGTNADRQLDELLEMVRAAKAELQAEEPGAVAKSTQTLMLIKTLQSVKETTSRIGSDHRELHSSVSKIGKAIDRTFVSAYDSISREDVFATEHQQALVNQVILQHLYRHGLLEIGDTLMREAAMSHSTVAKEPFLELYRILDALNRKEIGPALQWSMEHREELHACGTTTSGTIPSFQAASVSSKGGLPFSRKANLELKLHQLYFVQLLADGEVASQLQAIQYARTHFPYFVQHHGQEIQSLMGALMYSGSRLATSPYADWLQDSMWQETADLLTRAACALMGLSLESPLTVAVNAGCIALPVLLSIKQAMMDRQVSGVLCAKDELPIEIDLGQKYRYHSIFSCPILRQYSSESNPPMRLTCGHCISREALNKLANGHKLKCPYCPVEQNPSDARQITF